MGKVKCLVCGEILESTYQHDYKTCTCPNKTMVDGGDAYMRCGGVDIDKVLVLPIPDDENTMTKQERDDESKNEFCE
jgi:hypothetical protein